MGRLVDPRPDYINSLRFDQENISTAIFIPCVEYMSIEPRGEKTGLRGFRPGLTENGLCNHCIWLET